MKKTLRTLHRYLGLLLAGFLIIAGISGSILTFNSEFDALLNPDLYRINQAGQPSSSPEALVKAVEAWDKRIRIYYLPLPTHPVRASVVYVEGVTDPGTGEPFDIPYDEVFLNPVMAEVTGARMWGECCGRENFLPMTHKLHNRLFLPTSIGRPLWGSVAVLWTIMALIGLVLTWPEVKPRLQLWGKNWKIKWGLPILPMMLNLHRATGLWFWLVIIPIAITGAGLGFERQLFLPVAHLIPSTLETDAGQVKPPATTSVSDAVTVSPIYFDIAVQLAEGHVRSLGAKLEPTAIGYDHDDGTYRVDFGDQDLAGLNISSVYLSAINGAVTGDTLSGVHNFEYVASAALERIHSGRIAGLPGRILVFLCGWAVALISITGVILWWKRRRRPAAK